MHDAFVFRLADELREHSDIFSHALRVGDTHGSVQEIDGPEVPRVIEPVLRAGSSVQFDVYAQAILAGPFERFQSICPACLRKVRLARPGFDCPIRNRQANPIQAGASDTGKIFLCLLADKSFKPLNLNTETYDEGFVVLLELVDATSGARVVSHSDT